MFTGLTGPEITDELEIVEATGFGLTDEPKTAEATGLEVTDEPKTVEATGHEVTDEPAAASELVGPLEAKSIEYLSTLSPYDMRQTMLTIENMRSGLSDTTNSELGEDAMSSIEQAPGDDEMTLTVEPESMCSLEEFVKKLLDDEGDNNKETFRVAIRAAGLTTKQLEKMELIPSMTCMDTHDYNKIEALVEAIQTVLLEQEPTPQDFI